MNFFCGAQKKLNRREISRLKKDFPKQTYYEARRFEELEARMAADPRAKPLSKDDYIFRQVVRQDYEEDSAFRDKYPRPVGESPPVRQRETVTPCAFLEGAGTARSFHFLLLKSSLGDRWGFRGNPLSGF